LHFAENNGVKAGAAEGLVVLQEGAAVNGNDHSVAVSVSEVIENVQKTLNHFESSGFAI
jgi:hypothetical protein